MDARAEIQTLTDVLRLSDSPQDWGIVNSDPSRAEEFIRFCETAELTPSQQWGMGELVFASMNDALEAGIITPQLVEAFEGFLASGLHGLPWHLRYWSSLRSSPEDEFPIVALLQRLAIHA